MPGWFFHGKTEQKPQKQRLLKSLSHMVEAFFLVKNLSRDVHKWLCLSIFSKISSDTSSRAGPAQFRSASRSMASRAGKPEFPSPACEAGDPRTDLTLLRCHTGPDPVMRKKERRESLSILREAGFSYSMIASSQYISIYTP